MNQKQQILLGISPMIVGALSSSLPSAPLKAQEPAPTLADAYNEYADATNEAAIGAANYSRRQMPNPNVQSKPKGGSSGGGNGKRGKGVSSLANGNHGAYMKRKKKRDERKARKKAQAAASSPPAPIQGTLGGKPVAQWSDETTPQPISDLLEVARATGAVTHSGSITVPSKDSPMGLAVQRALAANGPNPELHQYGRAVDMSEATRKLDEPCDARR
jgi:hypothetical protein